ncbi:DoxX family membrane protein [Auraticoccus sp. F435]|uniref:DoxX family membrane protein n=1 Tax=Auraticoccus cholistanensis TaxID=2656650 RepID=A0A6A9UQY5_9ACTN|nr:DoxX family protein [Auraticoccus cholistanensis]MVA75316.1 DoxX family membrane protein [Auraticoccus cholistanensis]
MSSFVRVVRDLVLLVGRLVLGGLAVRQGWHRWQVEGVDAQTSALAAAGVPYPEVAGWAVTMVELVGGVLLLFGVLTPAVALLLAAEAVLALVWAGGGAPFLPGGGHEYAAVSGALALLLVGFGGGRVSVDRLFTAPEEEDDDLRYDESRAV